MTFLFLDKVAGIVGAPADLVSAARGLLFKEPVRHEGLRRLPRDEIRVHVAGVVVQVANAKLRQPLMDAVTAHALEAREMHEMIEGPCSHDEMRDVVIAAFAGNDVGIDMNAFPVGEASPEAVANQVLTIPEHVDAFLAKLGVSFDAIDAIVNEILAPAADATPWSVERLAGKIVGYRRSAHAEEIARSLFSDEAELRVTGFELLGYENASLEEWLVERAIFSSPESDEADVAEVLRLVNMEGGGSHFRQHVDPEADMTAAGAEPNKPTPAAANECICPGKGEGIGAHLLTCPMSPKYSKREHPVAAEPSDLTRAVTAALSALYELTKETDTHIAEFLGVSKATVNRARKGVTPWMPDVTEIDALESLLRKYVVDFSDALTTLQEHKV